MAMLRLGGTPRGDLSPPVHGWPSMPAPELPLKEDGRDFTGGPAVKRLPYTGWEIRIPHATEQLSSGATAREFVHCDKRSRM